MTTQRPRPYTSMDLSSPGKREPLDWRRTMDTVEALEVEHNRADFAEAELRAMRRMDHAREQTAATILAALTSSAGESAWWTEEGVVKLPPGDESRVRYAVALTDALRAELAKVTR